MAWKLWAWLLLPLLTVRIAAAGDLREEFAKLEAEMQDATDAYFVALAEVESRVAQGGAAKEPAPPVADRRPAILARMDALAASSGDDADIRFVMLNTLLWSVNVKPEALLERFEKMIRKYPDEAELAELVISLPDLYEKSGTADQWTKLLREFANKTTQPELKLAAAFSTGRMLMNAKKAAEAKAAFEEAIKLAKDEPDAARAAKAYIFEIEHLQVGMRAPEFKTKSIDDKTVSLKDLRGKVVLLNFWASWCAPCVAEIPHLEKIAEGLKGKPFEILAFSLDDSREAVTNFMKIRKMPGTVIWEEPGSEDSLAERYNVQSLPTWYLLDREGVIRARDPEADKLDGLIRSLLEADSQSERPKNEAAPRSGP